MIHHSIDPVIVQIGPLALRWYGFMYIIGFVTAYFIIAHRARRKNVPLSRDEVADLIFTLALGVILGGRLGYILFYNLSYYLSNPLKVFAVWEGGMSFHGGAIGPVVAGWWYARKKRIPFWRLADTVILAAPVGLFFGRLGNFINGELYGRVTDVPWGMVFPRGGELPRHPSQLYEAGLEGLLLFLVLFGIDRKNPPDGVLFWAFVSGYGILRFLVEFVREPDADIGFLFGGITMGQLLSLPMFLFGLAMALYCLRKNR